MSWDDAEDFLRRFIEVESAEVSKLIEMALPREIEADLSLDSLVPVLTWVSLQLSTVRVEPDDDLPVWIRECPSYARGLFEFDEPSKALVLRTAYYLGEVFVRFNRNLKWATGAQETAEKNMPVITGFRSDVEMAPLLVLENLFSRIIADGAPSETIRTAIEYWLSMAKTI